MTSSLVSAHPAGSACAGCAHPRDEDIAGDIPTISFVSLLGRPDPGARTGSSTQRQAPASARTTHVWPFGLDNPRGIHPFTQEAAAGCPVGCRASSALTAA